jgi:hypothetical protein
VQQVSPQRIPARPRRRRPLAALLAAALAALALTAAPALASAEPARSAGSFVDSVGVVVHTSYNDTPYVSQFPTVKQRLLELGVKHVRDDLVPERPDEYQRLGELAAGGIHSTLIMGDPSNGIDGLDGLISTLRELGGTAEAVEGPNEFDSRGGPGWASSLSAYQQHLYDAVHSDPALSSLPVLGPSIVHTNAQQEMGDVSGSLDYGNVHPYPNGAPPEQNLSGYLSRAAVNAGSKPIVVTETGYDTALGSSGELQPVSEAAMADYVPRLFLDYFSAGVVRTFDYELLDEWPNPGLSDPQASFGLLHNDLSPKPAFTALRNLISILEDPAGTTAAGDLDYTVGGDQSDLHRLLLRKGDGSYYLALWRAKSVWNQQTRTDVAVAPTPVTLDFGQEVASAERFMPNASAASLGPVAAKAGRLAVGVGAQVVILRLTMGGSREQSGRIKFWVSRRSVPAGASVAFGGRLPGGTDSSQPVSIQRWHEAGGRWQVVGRARTSSHGTFKTALKLSPRRFGRISRLRVVARQTQPSRALRVLIRGGSGGGGGPSVADAQALG